MNFCHRPSFLTGRPVTSPMASLTLLTLSPLMPGISRLRGEPPAASMTASGFNFSTREASASLFNFMPTPSFSSSPVK